MGPSPADRAVIIDSLIRSAASTADRSAMRYTTIATAASNARTRKKAISLSNAQRARYANGKNKRSESQTADE